MNSQTILILVCAALHACTCSCLGRTSHLLPFPLCLTDAIIRKVLLQYYWRRSKRTESPWPSQSCDFFHPKHAAIDLRWTIPKLESSPTPPPPHTHTHSPSRMFDRITSKSRRTTCWMNECFLSSSVLDENFPTQLCTNQRTEYTSRSKFLAALANKVVLVPLPSSTPHMTSYTTTSAVSKPCSWWWPDRSPARNSAAAAASAKGRRTDGASRAELAVAALESSAEDDDDCVCVCGGL